MRQVPPTPGKIFPSLQQVRDYIDRRIYLEALRSDAMKNGLDLDAAMLGPGTKFQTPDELMATDLPKAIKIELLKRWAYDAKELELAADEGMPSSDRKDLLQEINLALANLE